DPGSSVFYLSMEDQLLRIFGGDRMRAVADKLKLEHGVAIESGMLTRMIESAQRKVEGHNYDIRKQLLEFDDVQNDQRREIYRLRNEILESGDVGEMLDSLRVGYFTDLFRSHVPPETVEEQWDLERLTAQLKQIWGLDVPLKELLESSKDVTDEDLLAKLLETVNGVQSAKEAMVGHEAWVGFGKNVLLQVLDTTWRQHITALDALRQGIYLRGYAQKQPKQEYKREAFAMFESLLDTVRERLNSVLMHIQIQMPGEGEEAAGAEGEQPQGEQAPAEELDFTGVGRNDPCPCGSGKRYKDCHGKLR
ncbi:MAG: SEC-C domain-containing protein, partial [Duodenibacillus sp.]|nr:SEC-C domain-containing protein [Duodenibacillus sp.]